jgi:hypothetical protein
MFAAGRRSWRALRDALALTWQFQLFHESRPVRTGVGVCDAARWSSQQPRRLHGHVPMDCLSALHASYGPRDDEPRHRPSTAAAARGISEPSEGTPCENSLRGSKNFSCFRIIGRPARQWTLRTVSTPTLRRRCALLLTDPRDSVTSAAALLFTLPLRGVPISFHLVQPE